MPATACLVITTTDTQDRARAIAAHVLEGKLAACVQIMPVESHYVWDSKIQHDGEYALHIKTRMDLFEPLRAAICAKHTYDVPEIICIEIAAGHRPYLDWMAEVTRRND